MSSRNVPVMLEPSSRFYPADLFEPLHSIGRDPFYSSSMSRDPFYNGSTLRDPFPSMNRELVPLHTATREPPMYHGMSTGAMLPMTRSFFNPERQLSTMDHEMQRMASEMKHMYSNMQHLMPADSNPESWRVKENFLLDNPFHQDHSGQRTFRLQFDVRQFKPDEIFVKTVGNQLTVHAKHEEKADGKSVHREYHRQYALPKELHAENLSSKLNRDGVLTIEAPLPVTDGHKDKLIPIKHE